MTGKGFTRGLTVLLAMGLALSLSHAQNVNWVTTESGNWSQISEEGSTGWVRSDGEDLASYPNASSFGWSQSGTGATVTVTIDVPDATLTQMVWSNFTAHSYWIVNTPDAETNKLTFDSSGSAARRIALREYRQGMTFNVPIWNTAGTALSLAGGWTTANPRLIFNAPIEGPGSVAWWNVGNSDAYYGKVLFAAANTYTGITNWSGGSRGTGALQLAHNLALQNSTLTLNTTNEDHANNGMVEFLADGPFVLGGLAGVRPVNMNEKTLRIGNNDASTEYSGTLSNGTVEKIGWGTLTLSGENTYTGTTTVTSGILKLAGAGSIAASERITVGSNGILNVEDVTGGFEAADGQTLAGVGTVQGDVRMASGSTLAPGLSIGTIDIDGDLTLAGGSGIEWEFFSAGVYDRIEAESVTIEGGEKIILTIRSTGLVDIQEDDRFTLFDGLVFGFARERFELKNESDWAGGFEIEQGSLVLVAIPEPGLGGLLLVGGLLLGLRRRVARVRG